LLWHGNDFRISIVDSRPVDVEVPCCWVRAIEKLKLFSKRGFSSNELSAVRQWSSFVNPSIPVNLFNFNNLTSGTLAQSIAAVRVGGQISLVGVLTWLQVKWQQAPISVRSPSNGDPSYR
jgi:hypothetical protein